MDAGDILEALAPVSQIDLFKAAEVKEPDSLATGSHIAPPSDNDRAFIVDSLGPTPVAIDDIIRHTEVPPATVYLVLLELDLAGRLHRHPGGLVSIDLAV